jgi:hypothetical protein
MHSRDSVWQSARAREAVCRVCHVWVALVEVMADERVEEGDLGLPSLEVMHHR